MCCMCQWNVHNIFDYQARDNNQKDVELKRKEYKFTGAHFEQKKLLGNVCFRESSLVNVSISRGSWSNNLNSPIDSIDRGQSIVWFLDRRSVISW